jgi:hypothetical protein
MRYFTGLLEIRQVPSRIRRPMVEDPPAFACTLMSLAAAGRRYVAALCLNKGSQHPRRCFDESTDQDTQQIFSQFVGSRPLSSERILSDTVIEDVTME